MDEQFKRIRHLAAASHFRIALQNQELIRSIKSTQQELRDEVRRGTEGLRNKLENTIKELIIGSLQTFEPQWLRKFEDLIGEHESLAADFCKRIFFFGRSWYIMRLFLLVRSFISISQKSVQPVLGLM